MESLSDSRETIVAHLRATSDVKERAKIAGLTREPFTSDEMNQDCANCIYFLPRHAHCDLPELNFPVNPDWWCLLWRC
jgi:hypothetical protein